MNAAESSSQSRTPTGRHLVPTLAALLLTLAPAASLQAQENSADKPRKEFTPLFDGETLDGWEVHSGTATYRVEDKVIVGTTAQGSPNTFLCTKKEYGDFELRLQVKCDPALNSGIQIRSHMYEEDTPQPSSPNRTRKAGTVYGYQVEIAANGNAGRIWDEARHTRWHDEEEPSEETKQAYRPGRWNRYRIVARGNRIRTWINGTPVADIRDDEDAAGHICLQVHSIKDDEGPYEVRWRNIRIRELEPRK